QRELSPARMQEMLLEKRDELEQRIREGESQLAGIDRALKQIERDGEVPTYEIALKSVEPQLVASVRSVISSYEDASYLFDELYRHVQDHGARGNWAAIWHNCDIEGESIDCEALILLKGRIPGDKRVRVYELPATTMACIIHQGGDNSF